MRRIALGLLALCWSAPAFAKPNLWDVVREPKLALAERALRTADQARTSGIPGRRDPMTDQVLSLQAAVLVELAGGKELPTTELRFFLGDALIWAHAGREADGRAILEQLLSQHPRHPLAARAWFAIAIASSWLGDRKREDDAYSRALEVQWDPEMRSRIYLNRAETRMLAGHLEDARRDYERSLALTSSSEGHALAEWGLAVALSRSGNLPEAIQHAGRAVALKLPGPERTLYAIDLPGVFFSPEYEIHYYRALGAMAEAQAPSAAPREAVTHYRRALGHWDEYLRQGGKGDDAWLTVATQQRAWCKARLERAERRAAESAGQ